MSTEAVQVLATPVTGLIAEFYFPWEGDFDFSSVPVVGYNLDGETLVDYKGHLVNAEQYIAAQKADMASQYDGFDPEDDEWGDASLFYTRHAVAPVVIPAEPGWTGVWANGRLEQVVAWRIEGEHARPVVATSPTRSQFPKVSRDADEIATLVEECEPHRKACEEAGF